MIFLISDVHAGDERFKILNRPFDSTEQYLSVIKNNWNKVVKPTDTTIVVGDVCYTGKPELLPFYDELNGSKYLILGNHDDQPVEVYKKYFQIVQDEYFLEVNNKDEKIRFYINHYPSKGKAEFWGIFGHIHGAWRVQKNMINVSVDCWYFTPISLDQILFQVNAIKNFYDEDVWVGNHPANLAHNDRGKKGTYYNKMK
jgi:calcineurin-like phosphoesterase family protein